MPNVNANVGLDNYSQSGDQTLQQMQSDILAATGVSAGIAEQVRDPVTGRLVKVVLTMPDSAAANASSVIAANKGVATVVLAAPQHFADDLLDSGGIEYSGVLEELTGFPGGVDGVGHQVLVSTAGSVSWTLGRMANDGTGNVYVDGGGIASAEPLTIRFVAHSSGGVAQPLTIPQAATLRLHFSATASLDLIRTADITVPSATLNTQSQYGYWITQDGKLYLRFKNENNINTLLRTFEEAIQFPPA